MGSAFSALFDKLGLGKLDKKILVLGLDNAGKTTYLYQLKLGEVVSTMPTVGFNVEAVEYKKVRFTCWDVGGQKKIRNLWRHYYNDAAGLIYLVDSADTGSERMEEVKEQLHSMLQYEELRGTKVLVMANKQDQRGALPAAKLAERLDLHSLKHEWYVQGCCATTGDGMYEGLDWLTATLKRSK